MKKRTYDNSTRRAQQIGTRRRILDAAIECLAQPAGRLNMAAVARRARVSLPTVYRHFRTRDALLTGVRARVDQTDARPPVSTTLGQLRDEVPALHAFFSARAGIIRAISYYADLAALRDAAARERDVHMRQALAAHTTHLSEDEEVALRALLVRVMAAPAWLELKDRHHLPDDVITRMTDWAVHALLDQLEADGQTTPQPSVTARSARRRPSRRLS